MDVTVVIGTFGDDRWRRLAEGRALPSVPDNVPVVLSHAQTLHEARNMGLSKVTSEFVCHLDADDELTPNYFQHMATADGDVRAPAVQYIRHGIEQAPAIPQVWAHNHECNAECLPNGNWIVVGAVARTQLLRDIGGWTPEPIYEDWALWLRCHLAGAAFSRVPDAVYRAHVRADSRNRGAGRHFKNDWHHTIAATYMGAA